MRITPDTCIVQFIAVAIAGDAITLVLKMLFDVYVGIFIQHECCVAVCASKFSYMIVLGSSRQWHILKDFARCIVSKFNLQHFYLSLQN